MVKKTIVILLTLFLLAGAMIGCQSAKKEDSSDDATKAPVKTEEKQEAETEAMQNEEPVEITVYVNNGAGGGPGSEAGSTPEDYKMVQDYILEETGVLVNGILAPHEGANEKLAMMLAGGDELDMWWGNWQDFSGDGVIAPLNEYLDAYGKDIVAAWDKFQAWIGTTDSEGIIWGIPRFTPMSSYPVFVRQDWLELVNMQQPTTMKELEAYLYAIKDADPYGNGETIPLIGRGDPTMLEWCFVGGFVESGNSMWMNEDGQIMPLQTEPGYLDYLTQMNKWYTDGILHKEMFGWTGADTTREYIVRGNVGAAATWYSDVTTRDAMMRENSPKAVFDMYKPGIVGDNGQLIQTHTNASQYGMVMAASCDNPEEAIKVVNWTYESWYNFNVATNGLEGVHWNYADDPNAKENNIIVKMGNEGGGTGAAGYFANFCFSLGLPMETLTVTYDEDGKRNMHNLWLLENLDNFEACKAPFDFGIFFNTEQLDENIPTRGDIERIIQEEVVKFIVGQRSLSEYGDFIAELEKAGLADWSAEYTRQYNSQK